MARARRSGRLTLAAGALLACACLGSAAHAAHELAELPGTYEYLVSDRVSHGGVLYRVADGPLAGLALPYSFTDSGRYWGEYVCQLPGVNCAVGDYYDARDYAIKVQAGEGAQLQTERVNVHNGTNIYDAATWQIAVVLGAAVNRFNNSLGLDAWQLASGENRALGRAASRATTAGDLYVYNGTRITEAGSAYAFRMTSPAWLAPDPLADTAFAGLILVGPLPRDNPLYRSGRISWSDWKPITGDNAWGFLVGPLQAAFLHYVVQRKERCIPFAELAVQNAIGVLPAFAAMQSAVGAVYYAPAGTLQNQGAGKTNPYIVSIENNLSLYAGLNLLKATLAAELSGEAGLSADARQRIGAATHLIDTMLSGGGLPGARTTRGLREFLRGHAWQEGEFVTAGFADEPGSSSGWRPLPGPRAVDVQTWGVAALGAPQIDAWFGFGASFRLWERLKDWGAYGEGQTLRGVGYSDVDGNGRAPDGTFRAGVLSGEWTAGAIVMVRNMIEHYRAIARPAPLAVQAKVYVPKLAADEAQMLEGLQTLRYRRYLEAQIPGKPAHYAELIVEPETPVASEPYLYASRRYLIPFGWYANPIPSTASSAWAILIADHYDPFGYAGRPNQGNPP